MTASTLDINATFRGGGRSVEFLDEINKASIVMLAATGLRIAQSRPLAPEYTLIECVCA